MIVYKEGQFSPNLLPIIKAHAIIMKAAETGASKLNLGPVPRFWIAGGALTAAISGECINDFDVFSPFPETLSSFLGIPSFTNGNIANHYIEGLKVQVVLNHAADLPDNTIDMFDYTIVMAAYNGDKLTYDERFFEDIAQRRLVANKFGWPLSSLERLAKYSKRGYKPCPFGLLELAEAINRLPADFRNNPNIDSLTFYPDGRPRFNGVD